MRSFFLACALLLCGPVHAQMLQAIIGGKTTGGAPPSSAWTAGPSDGCLVGAGGCDTAAADTTGMNLIIVTASGTTIPPTPTDSKGNTYVAMSTFGDCGSSGHFQQFYVAHPTVGAGHTIHGADGFGRIAFRSFATSGSGPTLDGEAAGATGSAVTSIQPGALTPSGNDELLLTSVCLDGAGGPQPISINSGFSTPFNGSTSGNWYADGQYFISPTPSSINPTWSWTGGAQNGGAVMSQFKP